MDLFQTPEDKAELARQRLCSWASGFGRNSKGKPYLLTEDLRQALFPKAPSAAVVPPEKAAPVLANIRANLQDLEDVGSINIDIEPMEVGKASQVGDSTTFAPLNVLLTYLKNFPLVPPLPLWDFPIPSLLIFLLFHALTL